MFAKLKKMPLLAKVLIAIVLGIGCSFFFPDFLNRAFVTINGIFGNFLGFTIPLIILGLVAPGIAELGNGAGKLLAITAAIAYGSTLFAGFFSYFACSFSFPVILDSSASLADNIAQANKVLPYFTVDMPPVLSVTTALVLAFVVGLGLCYVKGGKLLGGLLEFRELINKVISGVIIPLLPLYIFGIFLQIGAEGQAGAIMKLFIKVIAVIFVLHVTLLLIQFIIAGAISKKNVAAMNRCIDTALEEIQKNYTVTELDPGEYRELKMFHVMKFGVEQYNIAELGNLSVMRVNLGAMQMATVVITPYDKNLPLLSADYMYILSNRKAYLEFYDVVKEKDERYMQLMEALDAVQKKYDYLE